MQAEIFGSPAKFPDAQDPAAGDTGPPATTTGDEAGEEAVDEDDGMLAAALDEDPVGADAEDGDVGSSRLVLFEN